MLGEAAAIMHQAPKILATALIITHAPVVVDTVKRISRWRMFVQLMDDRRSPKIKTYDKNSMPR
jgi:hypothetical protein